MTFPIDAVATADAIAYDSPSNATNFGSRSAMWVQGVSNQRRAFVYMARPFPLDSNVVTSGLRLTVDRAAVSASRTISVQLVSKSWSESKLTWDNQPGVVGPVASATVTGALVAGQVIEVDVQALMQLVSTGTPWYGFRIVSSSSSPVYFRSREATSGAPRLVGAYSQAPMAPSALSPSAGRAVSLARPTLSFDFTDRTGSMTAYRVRGFGGDGVTGLAPVGMSERVGSFNINGISGVAFEPRVPGIADTIIASGAAVIGSQEANSTSSPDEPGQVVAALNAHAGSSGDWLACIGANLNVIFVDGAVFEPQWAVPRNYNLGNGDGKYGVAMLLKHIASGVQVIVWTTHYLTSGFLTEQIKHTKALTSWLASLSAEFGVPLIGTGDFNAKDKAADRPIGMLALAGHIDVRDLVDMVTNGTYNSHDSYTTNGMNGWWIDHVFVSGGATPTAVGLVDSGTASDHNLVYADIDYITTAAVVGDLGEPSYDTGEVASTTPRHTLTRDIAEGELFWWQVQVKDDTEWSDWSEAVYFVRVALPSLTITNPAEAPDNFVTEPTPPFAWATVGTQTAYRVLITDPEDQTLVYFDTRRQGGADQSWTPPSDPPLATGREYRVEVRVEDDVVREATPGDPIYASAERVFTFDLTTLVTPVTGLEVSQEDERPWATVSFSMPTSSDAVEVLRDGVSLGTFAAVDLLTTGTSYEFLDRGATPYREHVWEVRKIVNGQTSKNNPTVTGKIEAKGVWLSLPDGSISVCIAGDPVEWSADEVVELFRPMGATRARIVTHGVFGREGRMAGFVEAIPGISYEEQRAAWYALADRSRFPYGTEMILTQSDGVTRVSWSNVLTVERSEFHDDFGVSATLNEIR